MGACRSKGFDVWPYMTRQGGMMMRGNIGTCRLKGFNVQPIVTCDTIVTAKMCRSKGLNVWPIVTCGNVIVTAQGHRSKGFDTQLIVLQNWVSPDKSESS